MSDQIPDTDRLAETDADMRREIVLREINQGALAGVSSEISEQAADLVLAALDRYDAWKSTQGRSSSGDAEVDAIRGRLADLDQADEHARNRLLALVWHHAPVDLKLLLSELEAAQARADKVAEIHKPERRYTPDDGITSYDTAEEAAGAEDIPLGAVTYFEVCAHCASIEQGDHGGHDYRESLYPCDTARALGLGEEADDGR